MQKAGAPIQHSTKLKASVAQHPKGLYPYRLNLYDKPPLFDVSLTEFETAAIDRLRVLSEIEAAYVRGRNDELKSIVDAQSEKYLPLHRDGRLDIDVQSERRKDHLGHFVLRLAFCRSSELRERFVKLECALFRLRYDSEDAGSRQQLLAEKGFSWDLVTKEELADNSENGIKSQLDEFIAATSTSTTVPQPVEQWYKVRWTQVPDLVERRKVVLKAGWAYVPHKEYSSLVFREFQVRLEKALEQTAKCLPRLDEDTRIIPILDHLCQGFANGLSSASDFKSDGLADGEGVRAEMVDDLAQKHWPLCMRHLHDSLRKDRHLKHYGRLQYGLFLKGMGLSVEEAIVFWRKAFGGTLTDDKFNKEYKYNIRHSYGLEGKRADYPPYNCQRIITQNTPGPTECHGCPYRHFSADRLQTALIATYGGQGLTTRDLPEIMHAVKSNHYHVACTRVYEITHKLSKGEGLDGESVSHPNRYATKSRELEKARREGQVTTKTDEDVEMTIGHPAISS